MNFVKFCTKVIEYSIYAIIFLVPLVFAPDTSELFELNKMWLTWGFAIVVGVAWGSKIIAQRKFHFQRTPLDIPIFLFLVSQIISTMFSLDPQVSWWGYYSRFNGGLLSTITYIFLYYAFVSNLELKHVMRSLSISLLAGLITALWGFPAHFGYDPTCFVFRGTLDTTCWTEAFKPTIRTFSTLGQPAWFAAYLALLIPVAMAGALAFALNKSTLKFWLFFAFAMFLYINLNFANTRAGFLAFWVGNFLFWGIIFVKQLIEKKLLLRSFALFNISFVLCNFLFGGPLGNYYQYSLPGIQSTKSAQQAKTQPVEAAPTTSTEASQAQVDPIGAGGTDSAIIRKYVWQGAIDAWKANPILGTGVETFAFAYYKYKPAGHNLTTEWDYLYNKAHNEYLNYLATTGIFGFGTYASFIGLFLFITFMWILKKGKAEDNVQEDGIGLPSHYRTLLVSGLLGGFITILITNFFGFSVVITNLYLFIFPLFILMITGSIKESKAFTYSFSESHSRNLGSAQWAGIIVIAIIGCWLSYGLLVYRIADIDYALGNNLDKVGDYQNAFPKLQSAVNTVPSESVYKDEFAINLATLSTAGQQQPEMAAQAAEARTKALALSDEITTEHPNNVTYWKNRVRIFYTLAQTDPQNQNTYLADAAAAITKAAELAPNDAKILYNLGVLYGQTGNIDKGIEVLKKTTELKPDYRDALYALGLFYHEKAIDPQGKVVNPEYQQLAIDTYEHILEKVSIGDKQVQQALNTWKN